MSGVTIQTTICLPGTLEGLIFQSLSPSDDTWRVNNLFEYNGIKVNHAYSFLNVRTSSHILLRSGPRGVFPPFLFPERTPKATSNSAFTSLAKAA